MAREFRNLQDQPHEVFINLLIAGGFGALLMVLLVVYLRWKHFKDPKDRSTQERQTPFKAKTAARTLNWPYCSATAEMLDTLDSLEDPEIGGREVLDCVIVGAGPAGLTAGLYLRRFHRKVYVVDAGASRAARIHRANNVAGFPQGVVGVQLLERMNRHLRQVDGYVVHDTVARIERRPDDLFVVYLTHEHLWTRHVILCTGVVDRFPVLSGIEEVAAADLLRVCPVCDGYEFTGKCIGVIGNSRRGAKEAAFLRHFSRNVWFIEIAGGQDEPRFNAAIMARFHRLPGLAQHVAVSQDRKVFVTMDDGSGHRFDVLYTTLGVDPRTQLAVQLGACLDERGNLVTDSHCRTSVANLYAAGDVVSALDQISVAVGHAAVAAMTVHNALLADSA